MRLQVFDTGHRPVVPADYDDRFGLVGMRERARALGGALTTGPTTEGWSVEAVLPL